MKIEADRPELVMIALTEVELRHPIENFARVEIAEDASLKLEQEWRMQRISEIQK